MKNSLLSILSIIVVIVIAVPLMKIANRISELSSYTNRLSSYMDSFNASLASLGGTSYISSKIYGRATSTTVICNGAVSTLLLATSSNPESRYAFEITINSSSITLCKNSNCSQGNGLFLASTTGYYYQNDNYWGAYSCRGNYNTSSTIGIITSQN